MEESLNQAAIVPDFGAKINQEQMEALLALSRDTVIEPFVGRKSLELVQKTRGGIESGMEKAKQVSALATSWLMGTELYKKSKAVLEESRGDSPDWLKWLDQATEELQKSAKGFGKGLAQGAGNLTLTFLERGFEFLLHENTEKWAVSKAGAFFPDKKIKTLKDMALLSESERQALIEEFYPYDNPKLKSFASSLDLSLNLLLGATAASQLPGSGLAAGMVNMGKTLVKLAGRISSMSAIYGYNIPDSAGLFLTCAKILKSIEDFESNPAHLPLDPSILDELYLPQPPGGIGFKAMLGEALKKEAYMAVPGVGVISLGKIGLDDLMVDQMVMHLVSNYFWQAKLDRELGEARRLEITNRLKRIYTALIVGGWFEQKGFKESEIIAQSERPWLERLKAMAGMDLALVELSAELDQRAQTLFEQWQDLDQTAFEEQVAKLQVLEKLN